MRVRRMFAAAVPLLLAAPAAAQTLTIPFDFSRNAIAIDVTITGRPLHMLLDTGVDPSVIDLARAEELGLPVDRSNAGEASGGGSGGDATVFPSAIEGLAIRGRSYAKFDALAFDMQGLSASYGRPLDGVLGYSFLSQRIVLFDYPARRLALLDRAADATSFVASCRRRWSAPLVTDEGFPLLRLRFGKASAVGTIDTGSNGRVALYGAALALHGVRAALRQTGTVKVGGARGIAEASSYALGLPIGFGPFTLPAGQGVTVREDKLTGQAANIGNRLFADLGLKMLLDYPHRRMAFYGDCG